MAVLKCIHELSWEPADFPPLSPNWYEEPGTMAAIALRIAKVKGQQFVQLPFDTSLEAECLGASIIWREGSIHGLIAENKMSNEALFSAALIEGFYEKAVSRRFQSVKRFAAIREAVSILKENDVMVIFNLTGPITVLSAVLGFDNLLRLMSKNPEQVKRLMAVMDLFYAEFIKQIKEAGVELVSYADPIGNQEVLGKRYFEKWSAPIQLHQVQNASSKGMPVHVCGNLSQALSDLGLFPYPEGSLDHFKAATPSERITGLNCIHTWK